jgi:predicted nucleic acid-binding protein
MHFELKRIAPNSIPEALAKVERYRLLNEPNLAESICLDILTAAPENQEALIALLLARTDQFGSGVTHASALELLERIESEYARAYYGGIVWERLAHHHLRQGRPNSPSAAYHALCKAMEFYEQAEAMRSPGNDDAILRWNTCARIIMRNQAVRPMPFEEPQPILSE